MNNDLTFDKAFDELKKLVEQIEDDEIQVDTLAEKAKQVNDLIEFCENRLRIIENATIQLRK